MNSPAGNDATDSAGAGDVSFNPPAAPFPTANVPRRSYRLTRRQALGALGAFALPWEQLLAQASGSVTAGAAAVKGTAGALPPDLVNLHVYRPHMQDETFEWFDHWL
jgi:hypothetical protein